MAKKAPTKKPAAPLNRNIIQGKALRYTVLRDEKKEIEEQMKPLSEELKAAARTHGERDEKGTCTIDLDTVKVMAVCTNKEAVDMDALTKLLEEEGLLERCTKSAIDMKEVEAVLFEGLIGFDQMKAITNISQAYSIRVDKK